MVVVEEHAEVVDMGVAMDTTLGQTFYFVIMNLPCEIS